MEKIYSFQFRIIFDISVMEEHYCLVLKLLSEHRHWKDLCSPSISEREKFRGLQNNYS